MDTIDKKIIKILKSNSKATLQTISDQINLSIAPTARRINQLDTKGIIENYTINIDENSLVAIITPDKDIIPDSKDLEPAYIVFGNYEKILQWNRSLRFALAVCTLKDKFTNAL